MGRAGGRDSFVDLTWSSKYNLYLLRVQCHSLLLESVKLVEQWTSGDIYSAFYKQTNFIVLGQVSTANVPTQNVICTTT